MTQRSWLTRRLGYERRVFLLSLAAGLPAVVVALLLLVNASYGLTLKWTVGVLMVWAWLGLTVAARSSAVSSLRTLSNALQAVREGDYTMRLVVGRTGDAMGEAMDEVNQLGDLLQRQRLSVIEATALLQRVLTAIDVAVLTFDEEQRLHSANASAMQILAEPIERLRGQSAEELGLVELLEGATPRLLDLSLPGASGRWEVRGAVFREGGMPHQLVVLSDLTRTLQREERQSWMRLTQILRHEINNSLAPIHSLASSLLGIADQLSESMPGKQDLTDGLQVIAGRSESLNRFMAAYSRLTRLPEPALVKTDIGASIRRVAELENRLAVDVQPPVDSSAEPEVWVDSDQLEQALINLVTNAVEATMEAGGAAVQIGYTVSETHLTITVEDEGTGVMDLSNLFVPFFSTKPEGDGIGLVLSRQIAEAHGGSLALMNREDGVSKGCVATLRLPIQKPSQSQ